MPALFCSGDAMRGGRLHHNVEKHPFLGAVRTAPSYRLFSVRDAFPALLLTDDDGGSVAGELYDVSLESVRTEFLPDEPPELELTVIELDDGRSVLAVGLRPGVLESAPAGELTDITTHGGWRAYRGLPDPDDA
ncbi:allophanate hydrolase-related protein [Actinomycetospora termitidis]|uniref:Gamma-glutamylcyclotransferase n=1 Tax=Actinomycetospora termitidis TaxID=3053470 RepID=A0ABT7MEK9_9PSEU|nr:gamma-glutamylcyclotransferase [Actinomycetospora sp. Odt1-22]MDL5159096.1 gamma-glutamylcyclotransferase [Actinomycetospora sp. Odt1-22]